MNLAELNKVATAMVAPGRGILAADESTGTIKKRFDALGVESTPDTRRDYREMLFRSSDAMAKYISGVILYDETIRQNAKDGTPLGQADRESRLAARHQGRQGHKAAAQLPRRSRHRGARRPARAARRISHARRQIRQMARGDRYRPALHEMPSYTAVAANTHALARYAALCQDEGIVPIVEPEVLMDGDHDIDRCVEVTTWVLKETFQQLFYNRVALEGMVLKPNMAVPGKKSGKRASVEEVADKTLRVLKECVPAAVPGIAFLSGGQSDEEATAHLDAMNKMGPLPWRVTFSYGRALQHAPQTTWSGKSENTAAAQRAFTHRAMMNGLATGGQWKADLERKAA